MSDPSFSKIEQVSQKKLTYAEHEAAIDRALNDIQSVISQLDQQTKETSQSLTQVVTALWEYDAIQARQEIKNLTAELADKIHPKLLLKIIRTGNQLPKENPTVILDEIEVLEYEPDPVILENSYKLQIAETDPIIIMTESSARQLEDLYHSSINLKVEKKSLELIQKLINETISLLLPQIANLAMKEYNSKTAKIDNILTGFHELENALVKKDRNSINQWILYTKHFIKSSEGLNDYLKIDLSNTIDQISDIVDFDDELNYNNRN